MSKLELCSGSNPHDGYLHLDRDAEAQDLDYVLDLMCLISPDVPKEIYPDAGYFESLEDEFEEILIVHGIEHFPWIYQKHLLELCYKWLAPKGELKIETPDLDWILKSILKNRKKCIFPLNEHPSLVDRSSMNFWKWVNFKIFSGGSWGDHHYCLYNKEFMAIMLESVGFKVVRAKAKGGILYAVARKAAGEKVDYYKEEKE